MQTSSTCTQDGVVNNTDVTTESTKLEEMTSCGDQNSGGERCCNTKGTPGNGYADVDSSDGASDVRSNGKSLTDTASTKNVSGSNRTLDVAVNCQHNSARTSPDIDRNKQTLQTESTSGDGGHVGKCERHSTCFEVTKDGVGCCHGSNGSEKDVSSLSCVCALQSSLIRDVPCESSSPELFKKFAVGCLIRSSVLLGTVQHTVTSFAKIKNEQLHKEIETTIESLQLDSSIIQRVRQYSEDDVFARGSKSEDASIQEEDKSADKAESSIILLTGRDFEQRWFAWAL
ncbi:uncharacterized protein [Amphiura filiformis]|uniref:uncharacterized protein n=1 Tax=Amphiura filiformis TaxID=82378 RepID=UPI003B224955